MTLLTWGWLLLYIVEDRAEMDGGGALVLSTHLRSTSVPLLQSILGRRGSCIQTTHESMVAP